MLIVLGVEVVIASKGGDNKFQVVQVFDLQGFHLLSPASTIQ